VGEGIGGSYTWWTKDPSKSTSRKKVRMYLGNLTLAKTPAESSLLGDKTESFRCIPVPSHDWCLGF